MTVLSNRFSLEKIVGKTVVIHGQPDDFTSQLAGNSGSKIGCGVIKIIRSIRQTKFYDVCRNLY